MPRIPWEPLVEYYDLSSSSEVGDLAEDSTREDVAERDVVQDELVIPPSPLEIVSAAVRLKRPQPVELSIGDLLPDQQIFYKTSRDRRVILRILGHTGSNPNILASIMYPSGRERLERGELIGSLERNSANELIPGVLREGHRPALKGMRPGSFTELPKAATELHVRQRRIIRP